ncbi:MAG TPA: FTR1 family protein [Thermomicrobiales bacterium]|nr:FTR1 family protein [Thermomicrobiales bacterium]
MVTSALRFRLVLLVVLVAYGAMLAGPVIPLNAVRASESVRDPGTTALAIRSGLYDAQQDILNGDNGSARKHLDGVADDVSDFVALLGSDSAEAESIESSWSDAVAAVEASDPAALASARGTIWTAMLGAAYMQITSAVAVGDAGTAGSWLLLREFRPTTKFSRPGANATLSIRNLKDGSISPDEALAAINADLLDTYQSKLDDELLTLTTATSKGFTVRAAESSAMIQGYWSILEPTYATQFGPESAADANATVRELVDTVAEGGSPEGAIADVTALSRSFRAAPLSEDELARRAGQLTRYLSLVPVEYGRGVKNGTVILDLEIQEAQTFLDASRASFADLHLFLEGQDAAKTDEIEAILLNLDSQIKAAATHTNVVDSSEISRQIDDVSAMLSSMLPEAWTRSGGEADFDVIHSLLDQMELAANSGNWKLAESARLEAYAIYEVGAEKRLLTFAPELANRTEQLFWQGTGSISGLATALQDHAGTDEIGQIRIELNKALAEGQERLGVGRPAKAVVIFNAGTIVFREGLEAVLIFASLMASMVGGNQRFKKPLVWGAAAAFLATAMLFVLARTVLSSLSKYGEKLEAIVSLIAVAVLLLIMNWFFHKMYWTRWIGHQHSKRRDVVKGAVAGQTVGLVTLGFTSVFREGAETVLFLQALVLDAGAWVVIQGTMLGLLGTAVVGVLVFMLQKKLPHMKMLKVTGVMIAFVLVTMVGNTVHVMQIVGWMPITAVDGLTIPFWMGQWFGVYSVWESLIAQAVALLLIFGSYFGSEFVNGRARKKELADFRTQNAAAGHA